MREVAVLADRSLSHLGAQFERSSLIPFLFHTVFENDEEVEQDLVYPQEAITRDRLRELVEDFLGRGYRFVIAADVERDIPASDSCVWLTFDDGYANNLRMAEIVREYGIGATLFVATGYVESGRRFWWDTVHAERRKQGASLDRIEAEIQSLKRRELSDIDTYVAREFGADSDRPRSELDRPLTPEELRELVHAGGIEIGNHTVDHPILPMLSTEQIEGQLVGAQEYIRDVAGVTARSVSYPNGDYDGRVVDAARAAGLTVGVTTEQRKNRVPLPTSELLELGRFQLRRGTSVRAQSRMVRSELQIANAARRVRRRLARA